MFAMQITNTKTGEDITTDNAEIVAAAKKQLARLTRNEVEFEIVDEFWFDISVANGLWTRSWTHSISKNDDVIITIPCSPFAMIIPAVAY